VFTFHEIFTLKKKPQQAGGDASFSGATLAACPDTCFDLDIIGEVLY
jgi:hypothetical protein